MDLAHGVEKLFRQLGILSPGPDEIASMTEDQLHALLKGRKIPEAFVLWFSLDLSGIDPEKRPAFEELKSKGDQYILSFSELFVSKADVTPK